MILLVLCWATCTVGSAAPWRGSGVPVDNPASTGVVSTSSAASSLEIIYSRGNQHAASELRRYLYLITAELPGLTLLEDAGPGPQLPRVRQEQLPIVLAGPRADDPLAHALLTAIDAGWSTAALSSAAGGDDHVLRSSLDGAAVICHGATTLSTRYAVYSLLETLGVGFRLHQDAVPQLRTSDVVARLLGLPQQNLSPGAITTRGIQPFHDFSEGPDQWNEDDYMVHFEQLAKLKMNFIGLHTYPNREPTVWTGVSSQVDRSTGDVTSSYSSSYMTTRGGGDWGGVAFASTDAYTFGSRQLMAGGKITPQCFGSDLLDGHGSCLDTSGASPDAMMSNWNELFNTVGKMLARVFRFGRSVGVQTCVGTEAPLAKPSTCANASATELYQGIFERITALGLPLDYYWIWTPEGWGARQNPSVPVSDPLVSEVLQDFLAADAALKAVAHAGANFSLATCGWTLGPRSNRS